MPVCDVVQVYEELVLPHKPDIVIEEQDDEAEAEEYMKSLNEFTKYFEGTWIGKVNPRTNNRGQPKFKLSYWNHYDCVMNGEGEITNNYSEAYNSQMKITVSMAPNIFAILKAIQDEEAIGHQKIAAVLAGNGSADPNPARSKKYRDSKMKLKAVVDKYEKVSTADYIQAVMSHFNA